MALDQQIDLRGLSFHFREWGGQGRPIVLLHGLASNCRIWDLMAPQLAKHTGPEGQGPFRILALDQRGHGQSAKPDDGYDFQSVVGDLEAFIAALKLERPVIVGHSWGGNVALQYGADNPNSTAGLVLVDGGYLEISALPGMTWERAEEELAPPNLDGMPMERLLEMAHSFPNLARVWSQEVEKILLASFELSADGTVHPHLRRDRHMRIVRAVWDQPLSELYRRVRCPSLLIRAQHDAGSDREMFWTQATEVGLRRALKLLLDARSIDMKDTIHDIPLQRPKELASFIADFAISLI